MLRPRTLKQRPDPAVRSGAGTTGREALMVRKAQRLLGLLLISMIATAAFAAETTAT
jgi:hypothetical protein